VTTFPPSEKARIYEQEALHIRALVGIPLDQPLNPYQLARLARLHVITLDDINGLSEESRQQLLINDPDSWSGGAIGPLPNGWGLVILNPRHSHRRNVATLMEEICHVFLGHTPSRVNFPVGNGQGKIAFRDYNEEDEKAAYAVGAATLVPYHVLRQAVEQGLTAEQMAGRYGVSADLVEYRIKVTGLWAAYKQVLEQESP
jgi:hypothetical protein